MRVRARSRAQHLRHAFELAQLELELRFLQEVNGCAKAPTTGPCATDDVAMCALVLAKQILGDAGGYGAAMSSQHCLRGAFREYLLP